MAGEVSLDREVNECFSDEAARNCSLDIAGGDGVVDSSRAFEIVLYIFG
jgi:hypothetical protein